MRYIYLVILFVLLTVFRGFGQKMGDVGRSKIHIDHPDLTIEAEILPVKDPRKADATKWYYWFANNMIHQTQGGFSGHLLNGLYRSFYEDGSVKESGSFVAGLKQGVWRSWNSDGMLKQSLTYSDGLRNGHFVVYQPDGSVLQSGDYDLDLLEGPVRSFYSRDSVKTEWYKRGKVVSHRPLWKRINVFKKHNRDSTKQINQP